MIVGVGKELLQSFLLILLIRGSPYDIVCIAEIN